MDFRSHAEGDPPSPCLTAVEAAQRLGYPPVVMAGEPLDLMLPTELHTSGSGGASIDAITVRYTATGDVTISTERRSMQSVDLAGAARDALSGFFLNERIAEPLSDLDALMLGVFARVRDLLVRQRTAVIVDGVDYAAVESAWVTGRRGRSTLTLFGSPSSVHETCSQASS